MINDVAFPRMREGSIYSVKKNRGGSLYIMSASIIGSEEERWNCKVMNESITY